MRLQERVIDEWTNIVTRQSLKIEQLIGSELVRRVRVKI